MNNDLRHVSREAKLKNDITTHCFRNFVAQRVYDKGRLGKLDHDNGLNGVTVAAAGLDAVRSVLTHNPRSQATRTYLGNALYISKHRCVVRETDLHPQAY